MALKEQDVVFTTKDANGNTVIQMPITRVENVEGAVKTVNGAGPNASGNVSVPDMSAATADAAGSAGLVPAPAAGSQGKYLRGDGTWQTPPDTKVTVDSALSATSTNPVQNKVVKSALDNVWKGLNAFSKRQSLTIGQSFSAPARGFVYARGYSTSAWGALVLSVNGVTLLGWTGKESDTGGTVCVEAGDTVLVSKSGTVGNCAACFVPIQ